MSDWKPFVAGETISGSEIVQRCTDIKNEINSLDSSAIPNKELNRDHLPSTVASMGTGGSVTGIDTTISSYRYSFPGWPTDRMSGAGWDQVPLGNSKQNWFYGLPQSICPIALDFSQNKGVLVLANAHVTRLIWTYKSVLSADAFGKAGAKSKDGAVVTPVVPFVKGNKTNILGFFMIVLKDASGNIYPVPKTLRYVDTDTNTNSNNNAASRASREIPDGSFLPENSDAVGLPRIYKDVAIRSYITKGDVLHSEIGLLKPDVFTEVQLIACVLRNHAPVISGAPGNVYMDVREHRVSAMVPDLGLGNHFYLRLNGAY